MDDLVSKLNLLMKEYGADIELLNSRGDTAGILERIKKYTEDSQRLLREANEAKQGASWNAASPELAIYETPIPSVDGLRAFHVSMPGFNPDSFYFSLRVAKSRYGRDSDVYIVSSVGQKFLGADRQAFYFSEAVENSLKPKLTEHLTKNTQMISERPLEKIIFVRDLSVLTALRAEITAALQEGDAQRIEQIESQMTSEERQQIQACSYEKSEVHPIASDGWQIISAETQTSPEGPWAYKAISPYLCFYFGLHQEEGSSNWMASSFGLAELRKRDSVFTTAAMGLYAQSKVQAYLNQYPQTAPYMEKPVQMSFTAQSISVRSIF